MTTPAQRRACRFVHLIAQCNPDPGNDLDARIVQVAQAVSRDLRAERTSSGLPITASLR